MYIITRLYFSKLACHFIHFSAEHFDSKGEVEEYIREQSIPHTILRASFYYQNFLGMFGPQKTDDGSYIIGLPMQGYKMDAVDIEQFGGCVLGMT